MNIAICDDEITCIEQLEKYLDIFSKKHKHIKWEAFYSSEELLEYYEHTPNKFDVLITDIEMNTINGVELANIIRTKDNAIIIFFLSNHEEYMRQCFKPSPLNFWDKPIKYEQFENDMEEALLRLKENQKVFAFKMDNTRFRIPYSNICYFESFGKKIILATSEQRYEFYGSCSKYEKYWENLGFIKINRGYYINSSYILSLSGQEIILKNGCKFPVSRANMQTVKMLFCENDYKQAIQQLKLLGDDI